MGSVAQQAFISPPFFNVTGRGRGLQPPLLGPGQLGSPWDKARLDKKPTRLLSTEKSRTRGWKHLQLILQQGERGLEA